MMKRILSLLAVCTVLLPTVFVSVGCSKAQTAKENVLRVYNWEDYISRSDGANSESRDLIAEFEQEYGVSVEYPTFGTNENMYNELKINPGNYDLVCPSDYMLMRMISEDMVEPFSEEFLSNGTYMKYVSPYIKELFEKNGWGNYAAAYMWGTMGYLFNPATVDENDLNSWGGIWNDTYRNKSTIKDSVRDSYFLGVAYVYRDELTALADSLQSGAISKDAYQIQLASIMNRTDADTRNNVRDALIDLKSYLYGFEVDSGKQDMITGKISINFAWSGDAVYSMTEAEKESDSTVKLKYIVPDECSNIWFDGWVMPKGANTALAEKFINFLSRPENAVANMDYIGYSSAIASDVVFDETFALYDESDNADAASLIDYDLGYFFKGTGVRNNYIIRVSEENVNRQLYARYPSEEVILRSAVMQNFSLDETAAVNEMWEEIKGLPIPVWAYIAIGAIGGGVALIALSYVYKGKRKELKAKKGYWRIQTK